MITQKKYDKKDFYCEKYKQNVILQVEMISAETEQTKVTFLPKFCDCNSKDFCGIATTDKFGNVSYDVNSCSYEILRRTGVR